MQDTFFIETAEQAKKLLTPHRINLLKAMVEPRTCKELAAQFEQSPQQINYHVKILEKEGLIQKVQEKRIRGTIEATYQAKARSYWLAPQLVGQIGSPRQAKDQSSLHYLMSLAEEMLSDVGRLGQQSEAGQQVPSLGLSAQIHLPQGARRQAFLEEVQLVFQQLATKYGLPDSPDSDQPETFKLALTCYPSQGEMNDV
ncbi:MAG: helix-turn-helix domain-containing protein [Chloroflexota bacterium]